jgi:hypothetical protein
MTWDEVCAIAREWPGVELGSYHGYPALRVRDKFLTRLGDDRASLEFKALDLGEREMLINASPDVFFIPDGFGGRGVFARLANLDPRSLRELLDQRWRLIAPKAAVKASGRGRVR